MSLEQNEFHEQFSVRGPLLPDSLDNATAFFYAINQLISSTPAQISEALVSDQPGFVTSLFNRLGCSIRSIVIIGVGWMRRVWGC
jgi:hypothetical protein